MQRREIWNLNDRELAAVYAMDLNRMLKRPGQKNLEEVRKAQEVIAQIWLSQHGYVYDGEQYVPRTTGQINIKEVTE